MRAKALAPTLSETPDALARPSLFEDRYRIDTFLERTLAVPNFQSPCPVPAAMQYAVLGDAQRYRPILAMRVARLLESETEHVMRAAAAVEILHSASLVVDDLPCMDNELMRRGRPAVHIQFGEPTAVLAAHAMVALAARIVMEAPASDREFQRIRRFQLALLKTLDCASLVGGQSLDLALEGDRRDEMREVMNDLKTTPLFQLAIEAGCVSHAFGPPPELVEFGRHFGLAFQLTDDYLDGELHNIEILQEQYDRCRASIQSYGENAQPLHDLIEHLAERAEAQSRCHR
jgi:geranylgeranyl pyrophosphate synthase